MAEKKQKYIKYTFNGIILIILIIAVVIFIKAYLGYAAEKNKIEAMNARLEELTEKSIQVCNEAIDKWGQADDATKDFVNDYIENINAAETPRQKSYIAQSMLAYVSKLVVYSDYYLKNENDDPAYFNMPVQGYDYIIDELNQITIELEAARDIDSFNEDDVQTDAQDTAAE